MQTVLSLLPILFQMLLLFPLGSWCRLSKFLPGENKQTTFLQKIDVIKFIMAGLTRISISRIIDGALFKKATLNYMSDDMLVEQW